MTTDYRISAPRPITLDEASADAQPSVPAVTPGPEATAPRRRQVELRRRADGFDVVLTPAFTMTSRAEADLIGNLVGEAIYEGYRAGWAEGRRAGLAASENPALAMAAILQPRVVVKTVTHDDKGRITRVVETSQ